MTFDRGDVVVVPFPFTDRAAAKRRPALVMSPASFQARTGSAVLAMITSSQRTSWPGDTPITDLASAGLKPSCQVRMKLFTLDTRLIAERAGGLSPEDAKTVAGALTSVFA